MDTFSIQGCKVASASHCHAHTVDYNHGLRLGWAGGANAWEAAKDPDKKWKKARLKVASPAGWAPVLRSPSGALSSWLPYKQSAPNLGRGLGTSMGACLVTLWWLVSFSSHSPLFFHCFWVEPQSQKNNLWNLWFCLKNYCLIYMIRDKKKAHFTSWNIKLSGMRPF